MKILAITNIFPNPLQPRRGIYNLHQFKELARRHELKVLAPLPWAPGWSSAFKQEWGVVSRVAYRRDQDGMDVYHPRYATLPKVGRRLQGYSLAARLSPLVREIRRTFPFDGMLATWAYPDVVAANQIAERLGVPLAAKVHGSDVNLLTRSTWHRKQIISALNRTSKVIAVSHALKQRLIELGVREEHIEVVTNGVDTAQFRPMDKSECRAQLGLPIHGKRVLFVGNLVPVKGLEVLLEAFRVSRDGVELSIVGEGPLRPKLEALLKEHPSGNRVQFVGPKGHAEVPMWMNAADLVCLPSYNEGCPNVVIEALACGRPVVATRVGGVPELLTEGQNGSLVSANDPGALATALERCLAQDWDPQAIHQTAPDVSWSNNAQVVERLMQEAFVGQ